ncbi:MAG: CRISPR-associated helicase Cas3' [Oscillospiraceae bacterium]
MQEEVIRAAEESLSPGIYIIEAQMGQGKTEAALAAAEIFASKWRCDGLFFGLPTQATANGIFPRLERWAEGQTEAAQLSIRLSHGMAMLQKDYRELFHGTASQAEDENKGIFVHPWFEGRKQALLSTFVVGTVDQLLMAALKQKHVMLRHLGLAGKVVVIDECHAYDAYMNQYLERALEWLGVYKTPVILLSATLPAERRARLIEAYHGKKFAQQPDDWRDSRAYPLLSYTDGETLRQVHIPVDSPDREVYVVKSEMDRLTAMLKDSLSGGGCAGVIVNTVAQAQSLAKKLREQLPEYHIMLAHARYTMADRMKREEELLRRLGKKSEAGERDGLIVVGTQLLEQSLDIDFDILATQLAPMDLLLQRIGRLHRHGTRDCPQALREARCIVCGFEEKDSGSQQIYGRWLLERTAQLLPEKLNLPGDISPLVQETYRDMEPGRNFIRCGWSIRTSSWKREKGSQLQNAQRARPAPYHAWSSGQCAQRQREAGCRHSERRRGIHSCAADGGGRGGLCCLFALAQHRGAHLTESCALRGRVL